VRVRLQSDQLVSDMSAFKAANPGSCLADFVRWHSPRDWIEEETEAEETRDGDTDAKIAPRPGKLSARMGSANNTWKTLWRDAPIVPASRQKPLFDPIREGERALEYLDTAPPPEIFAQILAAAAAAVGDAYAETFFVASSGEEHLSDEFKAPDAPSKEALTRAHLWRLACCRARVPTRPNTPPSQASCSAPSAPSRGLWRSKKECPASQTSSARRC
jgi:hypothetical protein